VPLSENIDSAFADYNNQFESSLDGFLADLEELEEDGFNVGDVLAALAALNMADYWLTTLNMDSAINAYISRLGAVLDDIRSFAPMTETQLSALEFMQRDALESFTVQFGERIRLTASQGLSSNRSISGIRAMILRDPLTQSKNIENFIASGMATFNRNVVGVMAENAPDNELYQYIGPLDGKTRPICRVMLASPDLTLREIDEQYPGAFDEGGGPNCRHYWGKVVDKDESGEIREKANSWIKDQKDKGKWKDPVTFQQYYDNR
tara:strand:+ start:188 stop:979 length:792 start_codon:yes stop_codon:yes gene_type:complete